MFVDKETIVNILLFRSFVTSSQLVFSCSDGPSHITTVGPSFSQSSRFPRPNWKKGARPNWKKGGADIIVFPSILVALLIYYSARDTAHLGDLYLASSNSSFHLVSFWMVVISACSWPSHRSFLFKKFYPPLLIVHPRSGSRHVKPSLVLILVSSSRSSHTCDKSLHSDETTSWNLLVQDPSLLWTYHKWYFLLHKEVRIIGSRCYPGLFSLTRFSYSTGDFRFRWI